MRFPSRVPKRKEKRGSNMANRTLKRITRRGRLTPEQAARDEEIRQKVQAEFPPLESISTSAILSDPLKEAVGQCGKSIRQLAKEARVSEVVLRQFLAGQRDLRSRVGRQEKHPLIMSLVHQVL